MSRDREREKKRDQEDEEEAYERRKLERKLRDKEAAYQEVGKAEILKVQIIITSSEMLDVLSNTGIRVLQAETKYVNRCLYFTCFC